MNFRQIKETCLYVQDLARTSDFYHRILDLPIIGQVPDRHIFFRAGSSVLLCFIAEATKATQDLPTHYGEGHLHLALECEPHDYERWKEILQEKGIPVEHEHAWKENRKSFYFRDPDQHLVEIIMPGVWGE